MARTFLQEILLPAPSQMGRMVCFRSVWWHMDSPKRPLVSVSDFRGRCAIVASSLDDRNNAYVQMEGDGSKAAVLLACSEFVSGGTRWDPEKAWVDRTSPPARAALLGCNGGSITGPAAGALPDVPFVLRALEQLRSVRIEPPMDRPPGVTDVKFYRVQVGGGDGKCGIRLGAD
jgi:hypothetical protein